MPETAQIERALPKGLKPWVKGQSGNPLGRPKIPDDVKALARSFTDVTIRALKAIVVSGKQPGAVRVQAASVLLDRAWGKPAQAIELDVRTNVVEMSDAELIALLAATSDGMSDGASAILDGQVIETPQLSSSGSSATPTSAPTPDTQAVDDGTPTPT